MIYNYFDGDDLSKLPNDKCQLLYDLLDVKSSEEILNIKLDNEYLQKVSNKMFSTKKNTSKKEEVIELSGLDKEEVNLISDISLMLKNIILDNKSREGEAIETVRYVYNFIQNLSTNKELKYVLGYFSKNFGYTDPNKFVFDENNLNFFKKQYDQVFSEGGWRAIRKLTWHMIFRAKFFADVCSAVRPEYHDRFG